MFNFLARQTEKTELGTRGEGGEEEAESAALLKTRTRPQCLGGKEDSKKRSSTVYLYKQSFNREERRDYKPGSSRHGTLKKLNRQPHVRVYRAIRT